MHFYKRWNNITGWAVFAVAAMVYLMTMEPVSSLWDCSEFIATSYKLEVGHPPGAPLFMMLARLATLFAFGNPDYVGIAVNAMNSLASAFCILFLFWTITHLARRLVTRDGAQLTAANTWAVLGAGAVGALAYTFTDTFWFSAVEGEVYALSSMFTALVVWLMLKWEEQADEPHSSRWIVLIAYLMGLSIGVHILNLLCIPALVFIYYFRKTATVTWRGIALSTLVSGAMIVFVNNIIIPYTVWIGAQIDTLFVNTFGLPVNSGITLFALALIIGLGWAAWAAHRRGRVLLNIILLSTTMILVGYSSYASVTIRAAANPPMNSNNPNNPHALLSLLNRDQYGDRPLLYGAQYSAPPEGVKEKKVWYLDEDGKYKTATVLTGYTHAPEFMQLFPRMWNYSKGEKAYKEWAAYRTKTETLRDDKGEVLRDAQGRPMRGETLDFGRKRAYTDSYGETRTVTEPTFWENVHFFFNYQLSYMYWRYFMWNFAGRQNDIAGNGEANRGNWISGIPFIDNPRLGDQSLLPDEYGKGNKGHNVFFMLPLLMGIIGLTWQAFHSKRGIEQFWVIFFFFFMTGIAIVLYLNQPPLQPRERDYAFAGSFYAFAIWVGMGVAGLWTFINYLLKNHEADEDGIITHRDQRKALWVAVGTLTVGIFVPLQVVSQTWDDHDRSGRYTTRDFGMNYLSSLDPNAIIFTNGDNDTFPLWYAQEVEGYRTDVRVVNLSYLTTDWYANQMRVATDGARAIDFSASPADYAFDRLTYNYFDPESMKSERVDALAALDDLYHNKDAQWKGSRLWRYPNMYIPSNIDAAVKAGVISEAEAPASDDAILVSLYKDPANPAGGATLSQALSLDMIATSAKNGWNRPAYFAMTVPDEYYLSLSPYLRNTGLAYQVSPLYNPDGERATWTATDKMYDVVTNKFRWGGLDTLGDSGDIYLDETVRRMVSTHRTAISDLAYALFVEGYNAARPLTDSISGVTPEPDMVYAADRYAKAVKVLDLMDEKLPTRIVPYSIQTGYSVADVYLRVARETGDKNARAKGLKILEDEIMRYGKYLPYFMELRRTLPGSGFSGLSLTDRYVPTYLYQLLQTYTEFDGDTDALSEKLIANGISLADLENFLPSK